MRRNVAMMAMLLGMSASVPPPPRPTKCERRVLYLWPSATTVVPLLFLEQLHRTPVWP